MLIHLAPPPPAKAKRKRADPDVSIEKNLEMNAKGVTASDSDLELELDVVMDIGHYSMTLGRPPTRSGKKKIQDNIDLGLRLVSSPGCTPVPAALPVPLPLRVSVEGGSGCSGFSALEKREKEKIKEYYLCSSSSPSTDSPSLFSPFERCATETDPSSPDTPYAYTSGKNPDATHDDGAINAIVGNTQTKKSSSFFGWQFAWDQEALERADDTGKLRSAGGGSPVRWKSDLNPSASKKIQPPLLADQESFRDLGGNREPSPSLSRPHSLSSEVEGEGRMKRGMSWRGSVCGVVGGEKVKRKNTLGLGIGMKPLRLSRSFGGTSNYGGGRGSVTGNGRELGHRTILSGDTGPMCGLSLKRKATALIGGQRSPVSPIGPSPAVSSRVMIQGNGDATRTRMITIATPAPTTPKRLKKKTKPGCSTGTSLSAESEIGERNSKSNHLTGFIRSYNQNLDSDNDEVVDADEDANLQKKPTMKWTRTYSHSPQSCHSSSSSPNQQQHHKTATSESHCSTISESCISTTSIATANTNFPQKLSSSLTRRGLSLKRSFKMGSTVGRTLGPGLTLSSASLSCGSGSSSGPLLTSASPYKSIRRCGSEGFGFREEEGKRKEKEKKVGKNLDVGKIEKAGKDDEDVDANAEGDMRSSSAATSASRARATATSTVSTSIAGTDVDIDIGGGGEFASRPGRSGSPDKHTTKSKSMLHSRAPLPTINVTSTNTAFSLPVCSTITEQFQQRHQQNERSSVLSTTAWKPHPLADWLRPSETSTSRGDLDVILLDQEMEIIRRSDRGNDNHRLSSLPVFPPLQSLLPPMTPLLPQSQSLPPTPTKYRSTLLGKPSISSFKKRSAPPALPPPPGSSEWGHSMPTMSGMSGAAVSTVSLAHSRSHSASKLPSRPTTPRPSMRLSAMNMGTVRNAFAGVGAKVSARMSMNSASTRGSGTAAGNTVAPSVGVGTDDIEGDFMDLRDPFAPQPPSKLASVFRGGDQTGGGSDFWVSERAVSSLGVGAGVAEYDDDDSVEVGITNRISSISGGKRRANMNAWGRLPMPSNLPVPSSAPEASSGSVTSLVANRKKAHSHHGERRKYKEMRARKVTAGAGTGGSGVLGETSFSLHGYNSAYNAGEEDADFDIEEALLSQRLLRRLDSVEWD